MDFAVFCNKSTHQALNWLGRRDWTIFRDLPEQRSTMVRPKKFLYSPTAEQISAVPGAIAVPRNEILRHPNEMWSEVRRVVDVAQCDMVRAVWYMTLSKALAGGPKLFKPTSEQCAALENTLATFSFDVYRQPYPVIIIEIPDEYRQRLNDKFDTTQTPSHVLVYHDEVNKFISVSAFVSRENIITHMTPQRPEYETVEDAITKNRHRHVDRAMSEAELKADFNAAENVQRLAMNFAMMMTLLGVNYPRP